MDWNLTTEKQTGKIIIWEKIICMVVQSKDMKSFAEVN